MTPSSTSQTSGLARSTVRLADLDVVARAVFNEPLHDKRLEQFDRHLLGQTALIDLQFRADDDNRTAGVVDTLAEQVLTEAALLAVEHVGQGLERTVVRAGDRPAAAAVVDQRVHGLLQHALFVAHDDVGRAQLEQALEAVVAVDDAAVQVVRGREVAKRPPSSCTIGRISGGMTGTTSMIIHSGRLCDSRNDSTTSSRLMMRRRFCPEDSRSSAVSSLESWSRSSSCEQFLDCLRAHAGAEVVLVLFAHVAVLRLGQDLLFHQRGVARINHNIVGKVQDLFQHARADIQDQAHAGRDALEVPDVRDRRGQLNVAHALAADLGAR